MASITCVSTPQSRCRFGIARTDITPPVGIYHRMWGAATHDKAAGVHKPLLATAAVISSPSAEDRSSLRVLLALDHCLFGRREMDELLTAVAERSQVPRESILVAFSHTHAAGFLGWDRLEFPGGDLIPAYFENMHAKLGDIVREAAERMQQATIVYGSGHCDLAGQRDFWDEKTKQFVCGFNPGADADDTVVVARVDNERSECLATLVNYACHPTTLAWDNQLISPDFPGAMREVIEQQTRAPCLFLQGASGDLGPRDGYVGDTEVADRNGRQLGFAALSTLTALPRAGTRFEYAGPVVSGATLGTWRHVPISDEQRRAQENWFPRRHIIPLPYREGLPSVADARQAREEWLQKEAEAHAKHDTALARDCRAMVERQTRLVTRLSALPEGPTFPYQVTLWQAGNALWVGLPGEPYNYIQRVLRQRFPQWTVIVIGLADGWGPSYLPIAEVYDKGIYQESIAVTAKGTLEFITEELISIISRLG